MKKYFVMSDIHSFYDEMMTALNKNQFDITNTNHILVICGDLFDRGPKAKEVFNFVKTLADQNRLIYIYGNHEELLFDCINEIIRYHGVSHHHIHNGTFDTIMQFTGINKYDLYGGIFDKEEFNEKINPLLEFIENNIVDFAQIGEYVCVHGWVPVDRYTNSIPDNWDTEEAEWRQARWINGMDAWKHGARFSDKTIICGHFHTSWGHSHIHRTHKEFPQKNQKNWLESFQPFVDEGIIALDACTAYTGICNCYVIER